MCLRPEPCELKKCLYFPNWLRASYAVCESTSVPGMCCLRSGWHAGCLSEKSCNRLLIKLCSYSSEMLTRRIEHEATPFESNQLTLRRFWIDSSHDSSGFYRNWTQLMAKVVFPGGNLTQLMTQAKNMRFWIDHDLTLSCLHVRSWLDFIYTQMTFSRFHPFEQWFILLE